MKQACVRLQIWFGYENTHAVRTHEKKIVIRYIWIAHLIVTFMQSARCIKKAQMLCCRKHTNLLYFVGETDRKNNTYPLTRWKKNWFVSKLCAIKKNWGIAWNLWNICLWRADCLSNLCTRVQTRQSIKFNSIPKCAKWIRDNKKKLSQSRLIHFTIAGNILNAPKANFC